jgi:predicted nucleic acid-binding protein
MFVRVLLDTNIIIHREAATVVNSSIGILFRWLDRLKFEKCVHPISVDEINRHQDARVAASFEKKLQSYSVLKSIAPDQANIIPLRKFDVTANDIADTTLLNELIAGRVDAIITEDRGLHRKAYSLGLSTNVFSIDSFLEKATAENPDLADYKILSVRMSGISACETDLTA